jgi:putative hydrolase of HD superfamily
MTNAEILDEMKRIRRMYVLKETMRYMSVRDNSVHSESVAEHLFGMQVLVQYFLPLEDPEGVLDSVRINEIILFHEIGEVETGDISFHHKKQEHVQREREAARRVADSLPESMRKLAWERFQEFETRATPESLFAVAIDKIEPIFQMMHEKGYPLFRMQGISREIGTGGKRAATEPYPHMRKFLDAWTEHMVALNAFAE